jgi:uncharacterized protein
VQFNVATLLQEPVGSTREMELEGEVAVPEQDYKSHARGRVRLMRTQRGILLRAQLEVEPTLDCARCLDPFVLPLKLTIDEEFVPLHDPMSGEAVEADPEDFRIDAKNHLDLSEAVRQYEQAALPIQPICRDDCAGLCPVCGQNRNVRPCDCIQPEAEPAWSNLSSLAERLRAEEQRGSTEKADPHSQARHAP